MDVFYSFDLPPRCFYLHLDEICLTSFCCSDSKWTSTLLFSNAPMNARTSFCVEFDDSKCALMKTAWRRYVSVCMMCTSAIFANVYSSIVFSSKHRSDSQITVILLCTWSNVMLKNVQINFRKWSLEMRGQPHHGSAIQGPRRLCVVLEHISETPCIVYVSLAYARSNYVLLTWRGLTKERSGLWHLVIWGGDANRRFADVYFLSIFRL